MGDYLPLFGLPRAGWTSGCHRSCGGTSYMGLLCFLVGSGKVSLVKCGTLPTAFYEVIEAALWISRAKLD